MSRLIEPALPKGFYWWTAVRPKQPNDPADFPAQVFGAGIGSEDSDFRLECCGVATLEEAISTCWTQFQSLGLTRAERKEQPGDST